jgi:hypothetical protein
VGPDNHDVQRLLHSNPFSDYPAASCWMAQKNLPSEVRPGGHSTV